MLEKYPYSAAQIWQRLNVFPSPDHVPYLHHRFEADMFSEYVGTMPYIPGLRVPSYLYIGHKPLLSTSEG